MPRFRIPESELPDFKKIYQASDEWFGGLLEGFRKIPVGSLPSTITRGLSKEIPGPLDELQGIVGMLFGVMSGWERYPQYSAGDLARDLAQDFARQEEVDASKDSEKLSVLARRLETLLRVDNLRVTVKAINLYRDFGKTFESASVATDIRPVFGVDGKLNILGGLVVHTMRIDFGEEDQSKRIYMSLDSEDLKDLRDVVDRALEKEKSIRTDFERRGLGFIDIVGGPNE